MPIARFRTLGEAARKLPPSPDPLTSLRTSLFLAGLTGATGRRIRVSVTGVHRYATVAEAEAERERFALARLREAGP